MTISKVNHAVQLAAQEKRKPVKANWHSLRVKFQRIAQMAICVAGHDKEVLHSQAVLIKKITFSFFKNPLTMCNA